MLMFMFLLGTFLVNSFPGLVLFESGASRSFVSQTFSRDFDITPGELGCLLWVFIANEHGISTSSIYQGCVLEFWGALSN